MVTSERSESRNSKTRFSETYLDQFKSNRQLTTGIASTARDVRQGRSHTKRTQTATSTRKFENSNRSKTTLLYHRYNDFFNFPFFQIFYICISWELKIKRNQNFSSTMYTYLIFTIYLFLIRISNRYTDFPDRESKAVPCFCA